jgi:hypothetical protein
MAVHGVDDVRVRYFAALAVLAVHDLGSHWSPAGNGVVASARCSVPVAFPLSRVRHISVHNTAWLHRNQPSMASPLLLKMRQKPYDELSLLWEGRRALNRDIPHAHDFATGACQDSSMTGKRILAITAYAVFTATCVALLALLWVSVNLLSFPCDSPEDPRPCAEVVPWFLATRGLLPIGGAWALVTWATFRRS